MDSLPFTIVSKSANIEDSRGFYFATVEAIGGIHTVAVGGLINRQSTDQSATFQLEMHLTRFIAMFFDLSRWPLDSDCVKPYCALPARFRERAEPAVTAKLYVLNTSSLEEDPQLALVFAPLDTLEETLQAPDGFFSQREQYCERRREIEADRLRRSCLFEEETEEARSLKRQFALQTLHHFQLAAWIGPDLAVIEHEDEFREQWKDPADLAELVEEKLALINAPLSADGRYVLQLARDAMNDRIGILATYSPRRQNILVEECLDVVKVIVPQAFSGPLKDTVEEPAVPIDLSILDQQGDAFRALDNVVEPFDRDRIKDAIARNGLEAFGWYQPYHVWDEDHWGIYFRDDRLMGLASWLCERLGTVECPHWYHALPLAIRLVWEHELFHARVEFSTLFLEAVARQSKYRDYQSRVYEATIGTRWALEEALANYVAREAVAAFLKGRVDSGEWEEQWKTAAVDFVEDIYEISPPGYRNWRLGYDTLTWRQLATQVALGRKDLHFLVPSSEGQLEEFAKRELLPAHVPCWMTTFTTLADGLFRTPSRREAERFLRRKGYEPTSKRGKGSHVLWKSQEGNGFPLPTGNPLSMNVFGSLLRHFDMRKSEYLAARRTL